MDTPTTVTTFVLDADELISAFTNFLQFDIASGGASAETIRTYWCEVRQYLLWCRVNQLQPLTVTRDVIKIYRHYLVQRNYKITTITLKLVAISRMYDAAMEYGLLSHNPVWGVKPPQQRGDPADRITYLNATEAQTLLAAPRGKSTSLKVLRDRCLLGLMTLEGMRSIEVYRANIGDIVRSPAGVGISVTSKRHHRIVPLIPKLVALLDRYLLVRKQAKYSIAAATPLFINLHHRPLKIDPDRADYRLSRRGIAYLVDSYLEALDLKHGEGRTLSAHSLRHTAGTLAIQSGASLRQVQDLLGHADPKTTAIYTHVGDRWANNPALKLGIELDLD
ncbi:MAG: site-specific integrase [Chamaesiphon sp.]|nr:site-specific integrase [Chamaesiphon sp.]